MHDMAHGALYMAHGYCLLWKPWLVALHVGSDALTAAAYFAIPFAIAGYVRRRGSIAFQPLAWLFVAFIALCGLTHVFGVITLWSPIYEVQAGVKALTAAVSVATALVIFPLIPRALALPRSEDLASANAQLAAAIAEKSKMLEQLERAREELESRVAERTAELAAANARLTSALRGSGVVVFEQDENLRYSWVMDVPQQQTSILGCTDFDLHDEGTARGLIELKKKAIEEHATQVAEIQFDLAGKNGTWALWIEPRGDSAGRSTGITCVAVDVTESRENERRMHDVMRELSHRSKNLLAIVAAIASQTARTTPDVAGFRQRFMERLQSLAATHDALVATDWRGVTMRDLVNSQLHPYQHSFAERLQVQGPDVSLSPHAAQYVALAVHELAANATKHGALATGGEVELRWQRASNGSALEVEWRETATETSQPAQRRGFGRTLLEKLVPRAVNGTHSLELTELGLVYRLTIDAGHLLDAATPPPAPERSPAEPPSR